MKPSVLVVDHDFGYAEHLTQMLTARGYDARMSTDSRAALASLQTCPPAVVVSELDMPVLDGLDLCRRIRETANTPIIILSEDGDVRTEVAALECGADDFIVKPIRTESLLARMRIALRRGGVITDASVVGVGPFRIDYNARRIHVNGQAVRLTPKEFDLFTFMAKNPNRVLPHKTLLGAVWGVASEEQSEYLRVFVGQLRKKLEEDPANPRYLVTEPWVGYRFNPGGSVTQ
jgi:two-component system, OmpR family, KDP operon response regulator KdpE